jgi:hypothetical protein
VAYDLEPFSRTIADGAMCRHRHPGTTGGWLVGENVRIDRNVQAVGSLDGTRAVAGSDA